MTVLHRITALVRATTSILAWGCLLVALLTGQPLLVLLAVAIAVALWAPQVRTLVLDLRHDRQLERPHVANDEEVD